jgi:hypothetical protein
MTNHRDDSFDHSHTLRVPRTRGAFTGLLLVILGVWGAFVPFIGPYFDYEYQSDQTWVWTAARFWLEVLPGALTAVGGLLLIFAANRILGSLAGWLAAAAGAWFVIGQSLAVVLHIGSVGAPNSTSDGDRALESLGFFYGLGAVIVFLAAFALGRLAVVGVRDVRAVRRDEQRRADALASEQTVEAGPEPAPGPGSEIEPERVAVPADRTDDGYASAPPRRETD